jgi:hypothetical protein
MAGKNLPVLARRSVYSSGVEPTPATAKSSLAQKDKAHSGLCKISSSKKFDLYREVFIRVYRLEIANFFRTFSHVVFSTQLYDPLPISLVQLSPPPHLPCVNKCTVYTYRVYKGGGVLGSGPQADKHLPQSPFTGQFLMVITFCIVRILFFLRSLVSFTPVP